VIPSSAGYGLQLLAASAGDAWVWGTDAEGSSVFSATHDGGRSWQPIDIGSMVVGDLALGEGTVWAMAGCPAGGSACPDHLLSSPATGGAWTDLGPLPISMEVQPVTSVFLPGPELVRSGSRTWVLAAYPPGSTPALLRSDDDGSSWTSLPLPCQAAMRPLAMAAASVDDLLLVCGTSGAWPAPQEIWASEDGGGTWLLRSREFATIYSPSLRDVGSIGSQGLPNEVLMVSAGTAWIWGDREQDLVSHDGGVTWTAPSLPYGGGGGADGLTFSDPLHGWTFGSDGLWVTTDGGVTWRSEPIIGPVPGSLTS
jgi:photosystem II stability/assembly factor-like uncharacterized protein